ncbi:MAG: hypothetical protein JWN98_2422 [Abditibacteriota bacterium]|nr:hypothetical protein [Abditibacteriota bacterium]
MRSLSLPARTSLAATISIFIIAQTTLHAAPTVPVTPTVPLAPTAATTAPLSPQARYNFVLGTQNFGPSYQFTQKPSLLEAAEAIRDMGSNIMKFRMGPKYFGPRGNVPTQQADTGTLTELARDEPTHRAVLNMPFAHFHIWSYAFTSGWWYEGFKKEDADKEYREMYDFATYLLKTYNHSGKTFYLGHWEGDWHLLPQQQPKQNPSSTAIAGMADWLNIRQKAIDDAQRDTPHQDVRIYGYTEVNLVRKSMSGEGPTLTSAVLPKTNIDFVSYSSYDSLSGRDIEHSLIEALNYIESKLPPKPNIRGKRVFIGEYGFPARQNPPHQQDDRSRRVMRAALKWGCPFVLYWQIFNNEIDEQGQQRGFWLIDDKSVKQPIYNTHQKYFEQARRYIAAFERANRRLPSRTEFGGQALSWLPVNDESTVIMLNAAPLNGVDSLRDFSKIESYTGTWSFDSSNPEFFDGRTSRLRRSGVDAPQYITYKLQDTPHFQITAYIFGALAGKAGPKIRAYASSDGKQWQEVLLSHKTPQRTQPTTNWYRVVLTPQQPLNHQSTHLKIELRDDPTIYSPQIGQVAVSTKRPVLKSLK